MLPWSMKRCTSVYILTWKPKNKEKVLTPKLVALSRGLYFTLDNIQNKMDKIILFLTLFFGTNENKIENKIENSRYEINL